MELKVDIEFDQLLEVIRQLPDDKKSLLRNELAASKLTGKESSEDDFLRLLLNGPTMSDDQYKVHKQNRNHFNKWRTA